MNYIRFQKFLFDIIIAITKFLLSFIMAIHSNKFDTTQLIIYVVSGRIVYIAPINFLFRLVYLLAAIAFLIAFYATVYHK